MKNSLGKIQLGILFGTKVSDSKEFWKKFMVIFLLTLSALYGEDFTYKMHVDNKSPYLKEATIFTLELNQTNDDVVLLFNFDLKKSSEYEFVRLNSIEKDNHHNAYFKYTYLIYPLKDGKIELKFNLIKKITNDASIAYSYSGDRDNVKTLSTQDTPITLPPLLLDIKPVPKDTLLVGDFKLTHKIKTHKAKAYEPISFHITLEGVGYPPSMKSILTQKGDFTRFIGKPIVDSRATLRGTRNRIIYPIAVSHKESFTLSPLVLKAFNPKTEKSYELRIPKQKFEVEKVATEKLIDTKNISDEVKQGFSWSLIWKALSYIFTFIVGYLVATALNRYKKTNQKEKHSSLELKIKKSKNAKELFQLLLATNDRRFDATIKRLEGALYRGEKIDFKNIKNKLIEI